MNKAVFIDKDGTLIKDVPYNVNPALIELDPWAPDALFQLQEEGYQLILVTNQPGIAKGYFTEAALQQAFLAISRQLKRYHVHLEDFYYCPHDPKGIIWPYAAACYCRKPQPGLLVKAAAQHQLDLSASWMIGDILHDVQAGNQAGTRTILLNNGHETEWNLGGCRKPTYTAVNWREAAVYILQNQHHEHAVECL